MCVLRADGQYFEVDEFLKNSSLKPSLIYYKGNKKLSNRIYDTSGFNVAISGAEFEDLKTQIDDAIVFLNKEKGELIKLNEFANV